MNESQKVVNSPFANPFAGGPGWKLNLVFTSRYAKVNKIMDSSSDPERDVKIAKIVNNGIFMTAVQVMQTGAFSMSMDNLKKKMNLLSRGYFLVKHTIEHDNKVLPVYTVGPACSDHPDLQSIVQVRNNFYKRYSLTNVLHILSVNQFCVRLFKENYVKVNYKVIEPYAAEVEFINRKYGNPYDNRDKRHKVSIISLRNYDVEREEFVRQLSKATDKTIVIAHDLSSIKENAVRLMDERFSITTDDMLFREKLTDAFYVPVDGRLVPQKITIFE